jgi:voltage-gated potassium channel
MLDRRRMIKVHAFVVLTMLVSGSLIYSKVEGLSFLDSLYSVVMITTLVGSNRDPQTTAGKIFLMMLALTSAGVFLSLVAQVFGPALAASLLQEWRMKQTVEADDHVILCGMSHTAKALLHRLAGKPVVILVHDERDGAIPTDEGFTVIAGDFTTKKLLEQAGIGRASVLIAASDDDAENAFACLTAKLLNPKVRVVARVGVEENREKLEEVGADVIVSPSVLAADAILRGLEDVAARPPQPLPRLKRSSGRQQSLNNP